MFTTPILLITFNRPELTCKVIESVRSIKPEKLYVFQDGPRDIVPEDIEKCKKVRRLFETMIDWECELHTNFQEKNMGCGPGPAYAMTWFFENVEYGIILEDDIIPHPLFYPFCAELLERYKDDDRVGEITGHNMKRIYSKKSSYYFTSQMDSSWGWATWRRVWNNYDFNIQYDFDTFEEALKKYAIPWLMRKQIHNRYKNWLSLDRHSFWDYQFDYCLLLNGYLNLKPNSCLTSNIGYDFDATHMRGYDNILLNMDVKECLFKEIQHPKKVKMSCVDKKLFLRRECKLLLQRLKCKF